MWVTGPTLPNLRPIFNCSCSYSAALTTKEWGCRHLGVVHSMTGKGYYFWVFVPVVSHQNWSIKINSICVTSKFLSCYLLGSWSFNMRYMVFVVMNLFLYTLLKFNIFNLFWMQKTHQSALQVQQKAEALLQANHYDMDMIRDCAEKVWFVFMHICQRKNLKSVCGFKILLKIWWVLFDFKVADHWQQLMLKMEDRLKLVNASVAFYKTSEQVFLSTEVHLIIFIIISDYIWCIVVYLDNCSSTLIIVDCQCRKQSWCFRKCRNLIFLFHLNICVQMEKSIVLLVLQNNSPQFRFLQAKHF